MPWTGRLARSLLALTVTVGFLTARPAAAATPTKLSTNGQAMLSYGSTVDSAGGPSTAWKPESKLFYTGNGSTEPFSWWGVLGTSGPSPPAGVWLFQLVNHQWVSVLQLPGADPWSKADTVFDGSILYVSLRDNMASVTGNPQESDLFEVPYTGNGTWGTPLGPFIITTKNIETLTLAKDSNGRLWVTFEDGLKPQVGYTAPGGTSFTFITIPTTKMHADDIADVTAFGGDKIGVFWSDQAAKKDFFAWRQDDEAIGLWHTETAYGGGVGGCPTASSTLCADDHMNIKSTSDGTLYVSVKTSLGDSAGCPSGCASTDPLVVLLRRDTSGTWTAYKVGTVGQGASRPNVVLAPDLDLMWVFATQGKEVDYWESSLSSPAFTPNAYQVWTKAGSKSISDVTTTKQNVSAASGTAVEDSLQNTHTYWHNEFLPIGGPNSPPTADALLGSTSADTATSLKLVGHDVEDCDLTFTPAATSSNGGTIGGPIPQNCTPGNPNTDTATVTYTPPGGFTGEDTFTYTVTDSPNATSPPATVTVTVNPSVGISLRSVSSAANPTAATLDLPVPSGVQPGDVMIAQVDVRGGPTITAPPGWTLIRSDLNPTQMKAAVYWKVATASEPAVYTWSFPEAHASAGGVGAYVGVDTSNPVDTSSAALATTTTSTITAPSISTSVNGEVVLGLFTATGVGTITPPSDMAEHWDVNSTAGTYKIISEMADAVQTTAGPTGDKIAISSASGKNVGQLVGLVPAV